MSDERTMSSPPPGTSITARRADPGAHRDRPGSPPGREGARHDDRSGVRDWPSIADLALRPSTSALSTCPATRTSSRTWWPASDRSTSRCWWSRPTTDGCPRPRSTLGFTSFGVRRAVVALTKADLVANDAPMRRQVRDQLKGSAFAEAPIVPTSVSSERGLDDAESDARAEVLRSPHRGTSASPGCRHRVFTLPGSAPW